MLAAAVMLIAAAGPAAGHTESAFPLIDWSIDGTGRQGGKVQLGMRTHSGRGNGSSNWSTGYPIAELQGLSAAQLAARGPGPVRFALVREAGRLDCSGSAGNGVGNGTCRFTADDGFAAFLQSRGIGRPDPRESYQLAMSRVGKAHVEALAANGYPRTSVSQLVALGIHGATPGYIQALAQSGYRLKSADSLVAFRIHGVDADYIRAIAAHGDQFRNIPADDLVAFRIHGVTPALIGAYSRLGYRQLDRGDVVAMAIHGVTPEYIEAFARLGYRDISADKLVQMRIHGVTPDYVRSLQQSGINLPSADQLVRLRISGFRPQRSR
jgi:hypothetical protein